MFFGDSDRIDDIIDVIIGECDIIDVVIGFKRVYVVVNKFNIEDGGWK